MRPRMLRAWWWPPVWFAGGAEGRITPHQWRTMWTGSSRVQGVVTEVKWETPIHGVSRRQGRKRQGREVELRARFQTAFRRGITPAIRSRDRAADHGLSARLPRVTPGDDGNRDSGWQDDPSHVGGAEPGRGGAATSRRLNEEVTVALMRVSVSAICGVGFLLAIIPSRRITPPRWRTISTSTSRGRESSPKSNGEPPHRIYMDVTDASGTW